MEDAGASQKVLREKAVRLLYIFRLQYEGSVLTKHMRLVPVGIKVATPLLGAMEYKAVFKSMRFVWT